jgi:penicillin G amidase
MPFIITATITTAMVWALNKPWGRIPAMGMLLSPQHGLWQHAESIQENFNKEIKLPNLKAHAKVLIDDKLVPHIFAENDEDAFYIQGYLHAKFRLWQMDFQVRGASGRISEVVGEGDKDRKQFLRYDREQLRMGMKYGAENSLAKMEADPNTKMALDNYSKGVNAYIAELKPKDYPIEFKLLGYAPENWTNLKTAFFLKFMAKNLAGFEEDFEYANAQTVFNEAQMQQLFPYGQDMLDPIVPDVTNPAGVTLQKPKAADSILYTPNNIKSTKPNKDNGSNNWAVSGSKTASGRPILCGDPHLGLNVPAVWFEMQIHTPTYNAYGATFPGAPCIIIGFNDSCAWSFTNGMRDVKDYYEIKFKDATKQEYWFNNQWKKVTQTKIETFNVRNGPIYYDTVAYTVFGPVAYDNNFNNNVIVDNDAKTHAKVIKQDNKNYAVRWKAHDGSNEVNFFYEINRAKNYNDYKACLKYFECPGQNVLFASKQNDIAITCAGAYPAKWQGQGRAVMPGFDSTFMWQGIIPLSESPAQYNPLRGFVSSANQYSVYVNNYPYYLGGLYPPYRGITINKKLGQMQQITPADMMKLQTDNYNVFAEYALPLLMRNVAQDKLPQQAQQYINALQQWNYYANPNETAPSIFNIWWAKVRNAIIGDDRTKTSLSLPQIVESTVLEAILKDSSWQFIDNINTPEKETLSQIVTNCFVQMLPKLDSLTSINMLQYGAYKGTYAMHISTSIDAFNIKNLHNGGGDHIINASQKQHGPSWRMVVHLKDTIEAYGVYPGGQSGNPGSKYYDNFADYWREGKYYPLLFLQHIDEVNSRIRWVMQFTKA